MPPRQPRSIYFILSAMMIGLVLLLYAALTLQEVQASRARLLAQAASTFARVGREAVATIEGELRPARTTAALLARTPLVTGENHAQRVAQLPLLARALDANPSLMAVFGTSANGSFVLLRTLNSEAVRRQMRAPVGAAYLMQSIDQDHQPARREFVYYDAELHRMSVVERPDYLYDPHTRPWYHLAQAHDKQVVQTAPYVFFTSGEIGVALAAAYGKAVAGMDVSLHVLSNLLARERVTPSAELMIVNLHGSVLASSRPRSVFLDHQSKRLAKVDELGVPVLQRVWAEVQLPRRQDSQAEHIIEVEGREWVVRVEPLPDAALAGDGPGLLLAVAAPRDELQADEFHSRSVSLAITVGIVLLMLPLVHWAARRVATPLQQLSKEAKTIQRFDFSGPDLARSAIREVDQLALAMSSMKDSLQRFLEISSTLAAERNFDLLLSHILEEMISVSGAAGGALHLLTADGRWLEPAALRSREHAQDGNAAPALPVDEADSVDPAVQALQQGQPVEIELDENRAKRLAAHGHFLPDAHGLRFRLLVLPLKGRRNETVGTLSLTFASTDPASDQPLSPARVAFVTALSGTAAVAIDNQQLLSVQKDLLESLIRLVAGAIDAKSPYTGGHCQRVPELTKMLARAACEAQDGPYAGYQLNEEQWEALHIATWLHDCGKVTTPEFVVDKATKLETIYDRIHEIRTRFELLKRDATIEQYAQALGAPEVELLKQQIAPLHAQLDEEFAFVAQCNVGAESMAPDKVLRLREIAQRRWWRTLDDRLGVSHEHKARMEAMGPQVLPVQEQLLADKPEHIIPRAAHDKFTAQDDSRFNLKEPEHLYNRGELYNISISRGTLTEEERYKINEHIVQTIKMLEALPFPRHLHRVAEIAGGHHERMDGAGYPKGLSRDEMSPEARMMAIADVFEALTADDRPYKKGKKLSEAVQIMGNMTRRGHIDPELFELFLRSGVYLDYARDYMNLEQIDEVNIDDCLS